MESDKSCEQNALINELIQGMEVARKLKEDLSLPSSVDTRDSLLQRILSSYDRALLILRWNAPISMSQIMHQGTKTSSPQSPVSVERSPLREDTEGGRKDHQELKHNSKKRKMMPKWTEQVRVKIENGVEGHLVDGYSWRKYGQKDILSSKYPRSYYRCTFRKTKGCCATKQVQRSEEDPTIIGITYRGSHTCWKGNDAVLPPKSPDIEEKPHGCDSNVQFHHAQPSQESLTKCTNALSVKTDNITAHPFASLSTSFGCTTQDNRTFLPSLVLENDPLLSSLSHTSLLSPSTPESNYFASPSFHVHGFDGVCNKPRPESEVAGIVSADTSTTNFPIFDFNFSLDALGIDDSNFPFNVSGFLS
ncbi:WRKY transcription factor 41 [Spatholobus suberectus]|nr:WRKY transcription factor 41 [Spatholobus suberectus]